MLRTDIIRTVEGITTYCAFNDHKSLHDFMVRENIEKCKVSAHIAGLSYTETIEISVSDIEKIL